MSLQEVEPTDIKFHFEGIGATLSDKLVEECIQICHTYILTAEELAGEWEAFAFNNKKYKIEDPTSIGLQEFTLSKMQKKQYEKHKDTNIKKEILSEEIAKPEAVPVLTTTKATGSKRKANFDIEDIEIDSKEEEPKKKESKKIEIEEIEEEENLVSSKSGKVTNLYNESLSDTITKDSLAQNKFSQPYNTKRLQLSTRYMNDEPSTRVSNFGDISSEIRKRIEIDLFGENLMELKGGEEKVEVLMTDKLEPFHLFLQSQIVTTARIGKETLGDGEIQIYIEGSHANQIVRTPLHFEKVKNYSFFPGQTIALKGTNPTSKLFRASAIRYPSVLPAFPVKPCNYGINLIVASGPFSSPKTLSYQSLQQLLNQVKEKKPDFLILNGPFVDERHPMIQTGSIEYKRIDYNCDQWFRLQLDIILEAVCDLPTLVLILPSQYDLNHPYCIYPQPKFNINHPLLGTKLFFMDDPSTITINEQQLTLGITSVDVLMHLASEEIRKGTTDRISLLLQHLLQQGSYYPIYPPKEGFCVDSKLSHQMQMRKYAPNILITPTDFVPFAKVIGQTLCINPGRASKGNDGTLVHIVVHPHDDSELLPHVKVDLINV